MVVTTAAYALIVLALSIESLWLLGVALVICGVGEANAAIASSVIADVTDEDERPKYLGWMFSVVSVSYVLGPVVGGALADRSGTPCRSRQFCSSWPWRSSPSAGDSERPGGRKRRQPRNRCRPAS